MSTSIHSLPYYCQIVIEAWGIPKVQQNIKYLSGDSYYSWLLLIVSCLASNLFLFVLQSVTVMMVLRVYAMWYTSKIIIGILLCLYMPHLIIVCIFDGVYEIPGAYYSGESQNKLKLSMPSCILNGLNLANLFSSDNCPDSQYLIMHSLE